MFSGGLPWNGASDNISWNRISANNSISSSFPLYSAAIRRTKSWRFRSNSFDRGTGSGRTSGSFSVLVGRQRG